MLWITDITKYNVGIQYYITNAMFLLDSNLLHASPVWMRHVEPQRRSRSTAGSGYDITVVASDVEVCRFQSID